MNTNILGHGVLCVLIISVIASFIDAYLGAIYGSSVMTLLWIYASAKAKENEK